METGEADIGGTEPAARASHGICNSFPADGRWAGWRCSMALMHLKAVNGQ